ncbi:hypothetical protein ACFL6S_18460 [Candidatus Poribacteria bacterium]
MKAKHTALYFLAAIVLIPVIMFGMLSMSGVLGSTITLDGGGDNEDLASAIDKALSEYDYSEVTVQFDVKSSLTSGQDDVDHWDIDIQGPYTSEANADLAKDKEVDCSGATAITFSGTSTSTKLDREDTKIGAPHMCVVNYYKFGRDWTIGNTESEMDDDISEHEYDVGDKDADDSPGGGTDTTLTAGETYLVTIVDDTDDDHIPIAFLLTAPTKGPIPPGDLDEQKYTVYPTLWADAIAKSKVRFDGDADDDQDNTGYSIDDLTVLSHDLTTAATGVDIDGSWEFELTDEVALILDNPFRDSNTEQAYFVVTPYVQDTGSVHVPGADGSDYGTDDDDFIYTIEVQGVEIVSDSSTDAWTDEAGDKVRPSDGAASGLFKNLYGDGAKATMTFSVEGIPTADYDAADDANDDTLTGGEILFNVTFYQVYTATEIFNSLKSSNQILS